MMGKKRSPTEIIYLKMIINIGIAFGPHQTEFQMCVMDLTYDFIPNGQNNNMNNKQNANMNNNMNQNEVNRNNDMNANQAVNKALMSNYL